MSKNYINALLKPFRESKVIESLLKLFESGTNKPSGGVASVKNEVNKYFTTILDSAIVVEVIQGLFCYCIGPSRASWCGAVQHRGAQSHPHPRPWNRPGDHRGCPENIRSCQSTD